MRTLIDAVSSGVPNALTEVITLGRTFNKRAADVLAYFDRPGTSNGLNRPALLLRGRAV
jgi:transposase